MKHAHKHFGAEESTSRRGAAGDVGHERHAAHRRAARPARHLHGRAAADAEGSRHQPAGRSDRAGTAPRRQPDRARVHRRPSHLDEQAGHDDGGARDEAAGDLRAAEGQDDVHRRRAVAALRRDRRRSSTRPRAPASRRSASSPRACGRKRRRPAAPRATRPGRRIHVRNNNGHLRQRHGGRFLPLGPIRAGPD